jgi:hypothetical protein
MQHVHSAIHRSFQAIENPTFDGNCPIFWRTPLQNLRKPSSSHLQGLKCITYPKRSFSPFDGRLKNDVGAPPQSEGGKSIFRCTTQVFVNRFQRVIYQNDRHAALQLPGGKLTCSMSIQLFTGASDCLKTRLSTITRPFFTRFQCSI